jgi:hypothetical protein
LAIWALRELSGLEIRGLIGLAEMEDKAVSDRIA